MTRMNACSAQEQERSSAQEFPCVTKEDTRDQGTKKTTQNTEGRGVLFVRRRCRPVPMFESSTNLKLSASDLSDPGCLTYTGV